MESQNNTNNSVPVSQGTSEDTKTIVTILLLVLLYPIGVIVMWFWPKWKVWVKILITALGLLPLVLLLVGGALLIAINPAAKLQLAQCSEMCNSDTMCIENCSTSLSKGDYPSIVKDTIVSICTDEGGTPEQCDCAMSYVEERVDFNDFIQKAEDINSFAELQTAMEACR